MITENEYDLALLRRAIDPQPLFFWSELPSTNSWALEQLACSELQPPAVVLTAKQTAGRGRQGRQWQSDEGCVTCSWVWQRPVDPASQVPVPAGQLAIAAALSVQQTLSYWLNDHRRSENALQIKWPNDVLVAGQKISGILIESTLATRPVDVIGIGININMQRLPDLTQPDESAKLQSFPRQPTSLWHHLGYRVPLTEVVSRLHRHLCENWNLLRDDWSTVCNAYVNRLAGRNGLVQVETAQGLIHGRCLGITDDGALKLETESGIIALASGTLLSWSLD